MTDRSDCPTCAALAARAEAAERERDDLRRRLAVAEKSAAEVQALRSALRDATLALDGAPSDKWIEWVEDTYDQRGACVIDAVRRALRPSSTEEDPTP